MKPSPPRPPVRPLSRPKEPDKTIPITPSAKAKAKAEEPAPTNGTTKAQPKMRLFNVITMHDFYVLAIDHDDARTTASQIIASGEQPVSEQVAYEALRARDVRDGWKEKPPWVSASLTAYEPVETDTCQVLWERIYAKR